MFVPTFRQHCRKVTARRRHWGQGISPASGVLTSKRDACTSAARGRRWLLAPPLAGLFPSGKVVEMSGPREATRHSAEQGCLSGTGLGRTANCGKSLKIKLKGMVICKVQKSNPATAEWAENAAVRSAGFILFCHWTIPCSRKHGRFFPRPKIRPAQYAKQFVAFTGKEAWKIPSVKFSGRN